MEENKISLVIPVYNESENIDSMLEKIKSNLEGNQFIKEIIFVNDGSTDETQKKLEKLNFNKIENININLISHLNNRGYGASIKSGVKASKYNIVAIIDCDQTYSLQDLIKLVDIYNNDKELISVIGSRVKKLHKSFFWFLNIHNLGREIIRSFASFVVDFDIKDINSGLRIFNKKEFISNIDMLPDGFSLTSSITAILIHKNKKIKYVDIEYSERIGSSKIKPIKDFLNFLNLILKITIFTNPLRVFLPIFLVFFSLGLSFILLRIFFLQKFFTIGVTFIILSFIFLFFGYVFEFLTIIYKKIKN